MVVFRRAASGVMKGADRVGLDGETPGHAQVTDQGLARIKRQKQVLGPPLEPFDPGAGQTFGKALWKSETQILSPLFDADKAAALQMGL
jgi:hypothetical protein